MPTPRTNIMVLISQIEDNVGKIHPDVIKEALGAIADVLETGVHIGSSEKATLVSLCKSLRHRVCWAKFQVAPHVGWQKCLTSRRRQPSLALAAQLARWASRRGSDYCLDSVWPEDGSLIFGFLNLRLLVAPFVLAFKPSPVSAFPPSRFPLFGAAWSAFMAEPAARLIPGA